MANLAERGILDIRPYNPARRVRTASDGGFRCSGEGPRDPSGKPAFLRLVSNIFPKLKP